LLAVELEKKGIVEIFSQHGFRIPENSISICMSPLRFHTFPHRPLETWNGSCFSSHHLKDVIKKFLKTKIALFSCSWIPRFSQRGKTSAPVSCINYSWMWDT
jgi:hypothetical protein